MESQRKLKIVIITSGFLPVIDGVTVSLNERLKQLSKLGHEVLVFCPDYSEIQNIHPEWKKYIGEILPGVNLVPLPSKAFAGIDYERNVSFKSYSKLSKIIQEFKPDIIHVDEPERLAWGFLRVPAVRLAKTLGIPCIAFYRTSFLDYAEDYLRLPKWMRNILVFFTCKLIASIYNQYDVCLASSRVAENQLKKIGVKRIIRDDFLGIDVDKFKKAKKDPNYFLNSFGLKSIDDSIKVLFLGRLTPDKNWQFTFASLKKIASSIENSKVVFIIAGRGPLQHEIAESFDLHKLRCVLLGSIDNEQIASLLVNCDLHVTTSEKETLGLTVLEAISAGTPVLVGNIGGVSEKVVDGVNGHVFVSGDLDDFVEKFQALVESKELRNLLASNCTLTKGICGWHESTAKWLAVVNRLIEGKIINE